MEAIVLQAQAITQAWAKRNEFREDSTHNNPLAHYDTEPREGVSILTLCSDGMPMRCLNEGSREADELGDELARIGPCLERDDAFTANYCLIDHGSAPRKQFDQWAQWQWPCHLIEADTADVSGGSLPTLCGPSGRSLPASSPGFRRTDQQCVYCAGLENADRPRHGR
ncbi:hypothetical protein SMJ63A_30143 [Stenotrophomonas geniculata]